MTTRERVEEIVATQPDVSDAEIGRQVGVTRERVRQILSSDPTPRATARGVTRERVRAIRKADPEATAKEISAALEISYQRVTQHLYTLGLPTATKRSRDERGRPRGPRGPGVPRVITGGVPMRVSSTIVGTIGEMLAAADLMARGKRVFFPLTRTTHCDLITLDEITAAVERIEVRCGHRNKSGRVVWAWPHPDRSDRRAIVLTGEPVFYEPPF